MNYKLLVKSTLEYLKMILDSKVAKMPSFTLFSSSSPMLAKAYYRKQIKLTQKFNKIDKM